MSPTKQIRLCKECDNELGKNKRRKSLFCNDSCRNKYWMRLHPRVHIRMKMKKK